MRTLIGLVVLVLFISFAFGEDGEQQEEVRFETASAINARKQYKTAILQAEAKFKKDIIKAQTAYIKNLDTTMKAVMRSGNLEEANKLSAEKKHIEGLLQTFKTEQVELQDKKIALMGIRKNYAPADAVKFNGHSYKLIEGNTSWLKAKEACDKMKGCLVCLESKEENDFVQKLASNRTIWIGGVRVNGVWKWLNGKRIERFNWTSGEPQNAKGQDYLLMNFRGSKDKWWDCVVQYSHVQGYIVEWDN